MISLPLALVAALAAGCLAALGFAPLNLWPVALAAAALLLWLVSRARGPVTAGLIGLLFGTGMFAVSLNWIATAFTYQAKMPAALGWVAVVGLALYLALFVAVPAALAAMLTSRTARVLALVALWVPAEWARGILLTGFAWNPLGAIWLPVTGIAQIAASVGAIGLTLIALLAAAGLLLLLIGPGRVPRIAGGALIAVIFAAGLIGNSAVRETGFLGPSLVLIQSGIGQGERYDAAAAEQHLATHLDLTRAALARVESNASADLPDAGIRDTQAGQVEGVDAPIGIGGGKVNGTLQNNVAAGLTTPPVNDSAARRNSAAAGSSVAGPATGQPTGPGGGQVAQRAAQITPTLVLWPEGAIDTLIEEDAATRARIADVLRDGDLLLAGGTGVTRRGPAAQYANTLFVIDSAGRIRGRYDKAHLVPLGEYVPLRALLEPLGIARLVPGSADFASGPGPRTLALPGFLGVSPVICYEIAFPQAVVNSNQRPAWIANVSNDAWFGAWGPPQHVAQARLRAIEEGLPIARATPTGQTVVINGYGQVLNQLRDGVSEAVVATLPPPLPEPLFVQVGAGLAMLGALLVAGLALLVQRRNGDA